MSLRIYPACFGERRNGLCPIYARGLPAHVCSAETSAEPSLQAKQLQLKRARLADDLNDKISHRPGPIELVHKNILSVCPDQDSPPGNYVSIHVFLKFYFIFILYDTRQLGFRIIKHVRFMNLHP